MNGQQLYIGLLSLVFASASVSGPAASTADRTATTPETQCVPVIAKAWIRGAPPGAKTLAAYLIFRNPCNTAVRIIDVESKDFGMPMIHRTVIEGGVSKMREPGVLDIKPGGSLKFEAGGLHVMLMQPLRSLKEGDKAGIRFVLADGRRIYSRFPVLKEAPKP